MIRLQVTIIILAAGSFMSCKNYVDNKKFAEKFNHEHFEIFKNSSMFIRSSDENGEEVIFAYDETIADSLDNGAYVITVDKRSKQIKNKSCQLMKDSTIVDKGRLEKLVLKFTEYPVGYLGVDSGNNVFIGLRSNTSPDLVRLSDTKYQFNPYEKWERIKDNWYEKQQ